MDIPVLSSSELFAEVQQILGGNSSSPQVVCFDFFDTLVGRSVPPEDTKKIASYRLAGYLDCPLAGNLLYQIRSVLEKQLCDKNLSEGQDAEFSLLELGQHLFGVASRMSGSENPGSARQLADRILDIELSVEKSVQYVNHDVVEILKYCRNNGVSTAIISDFYLPGQMFGQLLEHHNLTELVDHLFVSADFLKTKGHSGRLYDSVSHQLGIDPEAMVMIGDNVHADGYQANQKGVKALCLERSSQPVQPDQRQVDAPLPPTQVETGFRDVLRHNRAPFFPEMGLSLHWFTRQLILSALEDDTRDLFFCSKEGEFLRKLFTRYQEILFGRQVIRTHYLYVSRKATFICSLKVLEDESFDRLFVHYRDMSLLEFLQSLNFSEQQSTRICTELQLDPVTRHYDLKNHQDFNSLLSAPSFRTAYEQHRLAQKGNFQTYLSGFDTDFKSNGLSIVDVGWKGSIQNNIYYALDEEITVKGYYLGLLSPTEITTGNQKKGLLFQDVPSHSHYIHVFNNNRSLFEMLLGASHGSADGYFSRQQMREEGRACNSLLLETGSADDGPCVALVDLPEERRLFTEMIAPLQEVYLQLHESLAKHPGNSLAGPPCFEWFARNHARMVFTPRRDEVEFYSKLYHLENFGLFEFTDFDSTPSISVLDKLKNLWALKKDPAAFLETGVWPPIIFRRLGLDCLTGVDGKKRFKRVFGSGS